MSAIRTVVRGAQRRRVSTIVIVAATAMAVTATVLAGLLLAASSAPFANAFAGQHGAHLTAFFDSAKTTKDQAAATASQAGQATGPFPVAATGIRPEGLQGMPFTALRVVGRADPGRDPIDKVSLLSGRWARTTGEIVMARGDLRIAPGTVVSLENGSTLTVVGEARSISQTAQAWVTPDQAAALGQTGWQMLYRYADAGTVAAMTAHQTALGPAAQTQSWLGVRDDAAHRTQLFVPLLTAFGLIGLALAALVIGNVAAGTVASATRRIGVMKALGLTPAQVVRACLVQALIPGMIGAVLGIIAGDLLAVPLTADVADLFGTVPMSVTPWVDALAVVAAVLVIAATAAPAAWRAARLRTVDALAVGRTPLSGRGRLAARLAARSRLPRPLSLGLAQPFTRPARLLAMLLTVAFGTAAATFAIGLASSLRLVQAADQKPATSADVVVYPSRDADGSVPNPGAVIAATPGTGSYYGRGPADITIDGLREAARGTVTTGDASAAGYEMLEGRWYTAPGEAVVTTGFLTATGKHIGDTVTGTGHGPLTLVGEVFDGSANNHLYTDVATLPGLRAPFEWYVKLTPGTDRAAYLQTLTSRNLMAEATRAEGADGTLIVLNSLTALLTALLVSVAALGVLNAVVLDSRDRVHDIGVQKSIGMTPKQTAFMVISSVGVAGLIGGVAGVPAGYLVHHWAVPAMARGAGIRLPDSTIDVFAPTLLLTLALAGLILAAAGALLPAGWAARTRTAVALRTE
ncbi:ABC transporter permease [Paractinoplanes atraurantiacus]|uniref:Putative ABC transport system permease protein n=1 Tax=Paractinoplanes atraurantiacus TaxID=1036182 RepID=A0A285KIA7_9ACTN|nr:FtsX-like permease family protein [Actinoplanes atraurantiacus]SNY72364.1 putative ABC transport system permease protein [Actinoplanes atraurantiacus]